MNQAQAEQIATALAARFNAIRFQAPKPTSLPTNHPLRRGIVGLIGGRYIMLWRPHTKELQFIPKPGQATTDLHQPQLPLS